MTARLPALILALAAACWIGLLRVAAAQEPVHAHHAPAQARMLISPLELTEEDLTAGSAAYRNACARCHGADGKGGVARRSSAPAPSDLTSPDYRRHADGELFWVISEGIADSGMPAFKTTLDDRARWQLVAHLRQLGGVRLSLAAAPAGSSYVWDLPPGLPRPKVPADNPMSDAKVQLGRHLFYDTRLSIDGTFSCATCHQQARAFADEKARGVGVTGEVHPRGSMGLGNVAYSPVLTWANPTQRRLESQALVPMFGEDPVELGLSGQEGALLARLRAEPRYRQLFAAAFPDVADAFTLDAITRAIASFERTLLTGRSPYDRFRLGQDANAISPLARQGEALFFSERTECFHCHGGFNFTETADYAGKGFIEIEFHNTGLYNVDGQGSYPAPNTGIMAITEDEEDMGKFKAPSLRNIAVTAPYMHDGSIATLAEVIEHYAAGGRSIADGPNKGIGATSPRRSSFVKPIDLTPEEKRALVAFLESLTDQTFLTDPRFSSPWPASAP
ncbi:MAG: di-heme enzyme [Acidobacteria bacterium]|nr:di-heme enzyme [Acidobacteriota bacterium]